MDSDLTEEMLLQLGFSKQQIAMQQTEMNKWGSAKSSISHQSNWEALLKADKPVHKSQIRESQHRLNSESIHDLPAQMYKQDYLYQQQRQYEKFQKSNKYGKIDHIFSLPHKDLHERIDKLSIQKFDHNPFSLPHRDFNQRQNKLDFYKLPINKKMIQNQQQQNRYKLPGYLSESWGGLKNNIKTSKSVNQSNKDILNYQPYKQLEKRISQKLQQRTIQGQQSDQEVQKLNPWYDLHQQIEQQQKAAKRLNQRHLSMIRFVLLQLSKSYAIVNKKLYDVPFPKFGTFQISYNVSMDVCQSITFRCTTPFHFKMQINVSQIEQIYISRTKSTVFFIFCQIPKFYSQFKQSNKLNSKYIIWQRTTNPYISNTLFSQELLVASIFHKKFVLQFQPDQIIYFQTYLKRNISKIKTIQYKDSLETMYPYDNLQYLYQNYSTIIFMSFFQTFNRIDPIKSEQIQFSLLSLLYTCHQIEIMQIFKLAQFITKSQNKNNITRIWKVALNFTTQSINRDLKKKKGLTAIFQSRLQKQKNKNKSEEPDENVIQVISFKMTPSGLIPSGWTNDLRNRLVRHYRLYDFQFMKLQVTDDDPLRSSLYQCKDIMRQYIEKKLQKIKFLDKTYIPLGWTQSQLKSCSMWYVLQRHDKKIIPREQLLHFLGDFQQFNHNPALKAARIGQNLSTSLNVDMTGVQTQIESDQKSGKLLYTDGIGRISVDLVQKIQKKLQTKATIFQVRFQGAKGILVMNRHLPPNKIMIRESMKKFECKNKQSLNYLDILDQNYYKPGFLNRQIIILLQANNIPTDNLLNLQLQYIVDSIQLRHLFQNYEENNSFKQNSFIKNQGMFELQSFTQILRKISKQKPQMILKQATLRGVLIQKNIQMFKKLIKKTHIKVQKSARILGIIDQYSILQQNEVYCQIIKKDQERFNVEGLVMITRNPCMHPADIRVVKCISKLEAAKRFSQMGLKNQFEDLVNCVIFPKAGKIPLTAQISGSDLDGDTFFITWDPRLIPTKIYHPFVLDTMYMEGRKWEGSGYDQIIKFFSQFIFNNELGILANCHLAHADSNGANCPVCIQLCKEHSKAVDYPKKGYQFKFDKQYRLQKYPHYMQKPKQKSYHSRKTIGVLYDVAKQTYEKYLKQTKSMKCEIYSINKFFTYHYTDSQIRQTCNIFHDFTNDIQNLLTIYGLTRQFQLYNYKVSQRNKQSRDRTLIIKKVQLKYFHKFFDGLNIQDPMYYYEMVRNFEIPMQEQVQRKLILWYQISNTSVQKNNRKTNQLNLYKWHQILSKILPMYTFSKIDINDPSQQKAVIGLPWFSLPYLTYKLLTKHF